MDLVVFFSILAIFFAVMGMMTRIGRGDFLIKGFIRSYDLKKDKMDIEKVNRFMARIMYVCAVGFAITALGMSVGITLVTWAGILIFFAAMLYSIRITTDAESFQKGAENEKDSRRKLKRGEKQEKKKEKAR